MKDLGELKRFLGMSVIRDRKKRTIMINQHEYIQLVLDRFKMNICNPARTPFASGTELIKNTDTCTDEDRTYFQQVIGSLMYAAICTRPDIMYAVIKLSQFMSNPSETHFKIVKLLLRYLNGSKLACIKYSYDQLNLQGYSDSDWAEDKNDRKSTSGNCFTLANAVIAWGSKKQTTVACSSVEAEYMAITEAIKQALWYEMFMNELGIKYNHPMIVNVDSQGAMQLTTNPIYHKRTKHVDIRYHFIRDVIEKGDIKLKHVPSADNKADGFTKSLSAEKHKIFCNQIGLHIKEKEYLSHGEMLK